MPRITLDLSEARSFAPAEPGPYGMKIAEYTGPEPSKEKGTLGISVYFQFSDPKMDQTCGTVMRWYAIQGKGAGFFRELWKAATGEDLPVGQQFDIDLDDMLNRDVIAHVSNREYEGRLQNQIDRVVAA